MIFVIFIFIVILIIPYGVDGVIKGRDFYKRLRIGRWSNQQLWENAINNIGTKWIKKAPVIKKTDNNNLMIIDILKKQYKSSTIQSWQSGMVYLSIVEKNSKDEYYHHFINEKGNWKNMPKEIDYGILAYAIMVECKDKEFIKPAMDYLYNLTLTRIQNEDGCIAYRQHCANERYVDTVGLIAPFLALYGKHYHCENALVLAKHIIVTYYKNGFEYKTNMPVHAYDFNTKYPLGLCGWGRGVAWFILGVCDTYINTHDDELKAIMNFLAKSYLEYQREDGAFSAIMQLKSLPDSSVTATLGYFYAICAQLFHDDNYIQVAQNCLSYLMKVTRRNGEIDFSQGDTKGLGFYSITFNIMPFTQGMAIRLCEMIKKVKKNNE